MVSATTSIPRLRDTRARGCQFCALLCEAFDHFYREGDLDWPDQRIELHFERGQAVEIRRRLTIFVRFPRIFLYSPPGT